VSADPLTGSASASIPIYTVSKGSLFASVSLSYFTKGVKANDAEGSAGIGWSLMAGGVIYRDMRGLPDDFVGASGDNRRGWLSGSIAKQVNAFVPAGDQNLLICVDEKADYATINSFGYNLDTEPDIFSFHAPGLSGQFVFDGNKKIQCLPYQDLKIVPTRGADSLINQIEVTTNLGVKYTFQTGDKVMRRTILRLNSNYFKTQFNQYSSTTLVTYYSTWVLTSITSPDGAALRFSYGAYSSSATSNNFAEVVNNTTNAVDSIYTIEDQISSRLLSTIAGANITVSFSWSGSLLSRISISDNSNSTSKSFQLFYHNVKSKYRWNRDRFVTRPFLSGIVQQTNCVSFPGFQFDYYGVNFANDSTYIPYKRNIRQDIYGYYNGVATTATPEVYIATGDTGADGERYRIAPASGYSLLASGGSRSVNPAVVCYGALKTFTLPTGGSTILTYEPADYYDALTNSTIQGGGIRVKSIKITDNNPSADVTTTYSYKKSKTSSQSSGKWVYRPMLAFNGYGEHVRVPYNIAPDETIFYSRVEMATSGKGKTVYEFQLPGVYAETTNGDFNATLSRVARPDPGVGSCAAIGGLRTGYYTFPYSVNTNFDFERGLPVKISNYTSNRVLVSQTIYTYQRTTAPIVQVAGIRFESFPGLFQYGKYVLLSNVNKMTQVETNRVFDPSDTTKYVETATTYTYNNNQMLSQVSTYNSDNSTLTKNYLYAKDYIGMTATDTQSRTVNSLINANRHGTLVESYSQNGAAYTDASLVLFNDTFGGKVLPWQKLSLSNPTGFLKSSVSAGAFIYSSSNYYTTQFIDAYDSLGNVLVTRDQSRALSSVKLGYNNSLPILKISNARYDQVVFSDFENGELSGITFNGATITTADSWSGRASLVLSPGNTPQASLSRGYGNYYRFSAWVKASTPATITVQFNNGTAWVANTVNYPNAGSPSGTWQYIETRIDISSSPISGVFPIQVLTSAAVNIDNLMFYPEAADVSSNTYEPLYGASASLDTRGNAGFTQFDQLGRPHYILNKDKDIVQVKDYHFKAQVNSAASAWIASPIGSIYTGSPATFNAATTCMNGITYTWYLDDVNQNNNTSSFTSTFLENRQYVIKLVVNYSGGSIAVISKVQPVPVFNASFSFSGGSSFNCRDATFTRTITATATGCYEALIFNWVVKSDNGTLLGSGTATTNVFDVNLYTGQNNTIIVWVESTCYNSSTNRHDQVQSTTKSFSVGWSPLGPC
jgi:hypothetical protein